MNELNKPVVQDSKIELWLWSLIVIVSICVGLMASRSGVGNALMIWCISLISGFFYLTPSFVAISRNHTNKNAIVALNILLGWMLLPWIGALIWALTRNRAAELMEAQQTAALERVCPFCAETVKAAALICKHCQRELPPLKHGAAQQPGVARLEPS
ncbi:MAG: superinfection immunity protein [Betaproteobacteria bacterium]|nr:superinfection immunity protein [Betaproteobacteria bacterium]MCL2886531.1 superinfection immunity protein [Betaproteobacteria bacterium]